MVGGELGRVVVAFARDAAALRVVADPDQLMVGGCSSARISSMYFGGAT
jgi:hypothetical protein